MLQNVSTCIFQKQSGEKSVVSVVPMRTILDVIIISFFFFLSFPQIKPRELITDSLLGIIINKGVYGNCVRHSLTRWWQCAQFLDVIIIISFSIKNRTHPRGMYKWTFCKHFSSPFIFITNKTKSYFFFWVTRHDCFFWHRYFGWIGFFDEKEKIAPNTRFIRLVGDGVNIVYYRHLLARWHHVSLIRHQVDAEFPFPQLIALLGFIVLNVDGWCFCELPLGGASLVFLEMAPL